MADLIYEIDGGDGNIYEIQAPEGTSEEDLFSFVQQQQYEKTVEQSSREEEDVTVEEPKRTAPVRQEEDLFSTNVGRGVDLIQQMYGSALEGAGSVTGLEGVKDYGTEIEQANRRELEATAGATRSTKDIDGAGGLLDYALATFGAQVPQLGSTLAGSAAGALVGSVVPVIGTTIGGIAGGIAANLPFFYGSNREAQKEAIDAGIKQELSEGAAALAAIPQSVLDFIADRFLIGGFTSKAAMGGGIFTRAIKGTTLGVVTEVPTEIGQQVLERLQANQELFSKEALDEYFEVAVAAGLVGGTVKGVGNVYGGRKRFEDDPDDSTDLDDSTDPIAAQQELAAARERDALDAAERGDEAGFDQPDLFPEDATRVRASAEQVKSALSSAPLRDQLRAEEAAAEQPIGTYTEQEVEARRPAAERKARANTETGQVEPSAFETEVEIRKELIQEKAGLEYEDGNKERVILVIPEEEAKTRARLDAEEARRTGTPTTSDPRQDDFVDISETAQLKEMEEQELEQKTTNRLSRIAKQIDDKQQQETARQRGAVLDSVLTDIGTASRANTTQRFSQALSDAGITNTTPTQQEYSLINRATDVVAATQDDTLIGSAGEDVLAPVPTDVPSRKEARAQKGVERTAKDQAAAEQRTNTRILTEQDLEWGPKQIKDLKGQDIGNPGPARKRVQKQLEVLEKNAKGLKNPNAIAANKIKQQRARELLSGERVAASPEGDVSTTTEETQDGSVQQVTVNEEPIPTNIVDKPTGTTGVEPVVPPRLLPVGGDTAGFVSSTDDRMGNTAAGLGRTLGGIGTKFRALKADPEVPAKKVLTKKELQARRIKIEETAKKRKKQKEQVAKKDVDKKIEAGKKARAVEKATTEKIKKSKVKTYFDGDGNIVTTIPEGKSGKKVVRKTSPKKKQLNIDIGEREDLKLFTAPEEASVKFEVATTDADVVKVDALVRTKVKRAEQRKETAKDKDTSGAKKYFGRKDDPIEALEEIVYDLVYGPFKGAYRLKDVDQTAKDRIEKTADSKGLEKGTPERKDYIKKQKQKAIEAGEGAYIEAETLYFEGKGKPAAKEAMRWVRDNLDPKTVQQVADLYALEIRDSKSKRFSEEEASLDVTKIGPARSTMQESYLAATAKQAEEWVTAELNENIALYEADLKAVREAAKAKQSGKEAGAVSILDDVNTEASVTTENIKELLLKSGQVVGLDLPTHPVINNLLRAGKLKEALRVLAITSPSSRVSQVASKLGQKLGDTKVEVVKGLTNEAGVSVAGLFDPKTNTIKLDATTGINPHTILHETTHALTSATVANKSHKVTKQLTKLFNELKAQGALDSFYGAQNLDEFVAEVFGNPEFQQKLANTIPKHNYIVDGVPVSALQRFFNTVSNFIRNILGMKTKPVGSALNQADQFIEAMLAPAPEFRNAEALPLNLKKIGDNINAMQQAFNDKFTPEFRAKTKDKFLNIFDNDTTTKAVKGTLAGFSPMQLLAEDIAPAYGLDAASNLYLIIDTAMGDTGFAETRVDGTLKKLRGYFKSIPAAEREKVKKAFNRLVYGSTREQVHPYPDSYDGGKIPEKGTPERVTYDKMEDDKDLIGEDGRAAYLLLERAYEKQFNSLKAVVTERIKNLDLTPAEKIKMQKTIFDKLFQKGRLKPYFPLTRKGNLWLNFEGKDAEGKPEMVRMAFETNTARKAFKAQLERENPENELDPDGYGPGGVKRKSINAYENATDAFSGKGAPAGDFVNATMKLLEGAEVEVREGFMSLFIDSLPESSFAKAMSQRSNEGRGVAGFIEDAEDAFRQKAYNLAAQIERMKASNSIDAVVKELEAQYEYAKETPEIDATNARIIYDELVARANFAKNPPSDKIASTVNKFAFFMTLGFNASSAIVNLSQIPLMMAPILGGKYGYEATYQAIRDASVIFTGSGGTRRVGTIDSVGSDVEVKAAWSMDNYFDTMDDGSLVIRPEKLEGLDPKNKKDKAKIARLNSLKTLVEVAGGRGQLLRSLFYDTMGVETSGREKGVFDGISAASAWIFHHAERYNRQVALGATYTLELSRMKKQKVGAAAYNKLSQDQKDAIELTKEQEVKAANQSVLQAQEMNGGAFLATAPRYAQKGLGRAAMMYKTFGVQMYVTMFKIARQSFLVDLPKNLKEQQGVSDAVAKTMSQTAFKQLKGIMGSSILLAGVQGAPIYGVLSMIVDLSRDEDEEDFDTTTRQFLGEGLYKGGVNALFGVDVANRIGLSDLLFRMNPYRNPNAGFLDIVGETFLGPGASVMGQVWRGGKDIIGGKDFWRGVETMLPTSVRNATKAARLSPLLGEGAKETLRGDIIADDVTNGEALAQLFGFAPTKVTFEQERNMSVRNIDRATGERRSNILKKLYRTFNEGDGAGFQDVLDEVIKFNKKHYYYAISSDTINKSLRTAYATTASMHNGLSISPKLRATLLNHKDDYWGRNEWNLLNPLKF